MSKLKTPLPPNSDVPVSNRTVTRLEIARNQERHWRELHRISAKNIRHNNLGNSWGKASPTKSTPLYPHLHNNLKRVQASRS